MAKEKFEDALEKLEDMVKKMEAGDLRLDEALKSFEAVPLDAGKYELPPQW